MFHAGIVAVPLMRCFPSLYGPRIRREKDEDPVFPEQAADLREQRHRIWEMLDDVKCGDDVVAQSHDIAPDNAQTLRGRDARRIA